MDNYSNELENFYRSISEQKNYLVECPFYFNTFIREYDMSKANASILLWKGVIDRKQYNFIVNLPRMDRQVMIGNMQKKKEINNIMEEGVKECRYMFLKENNLMPTDILSIKNDAIFVINKKIQNNRFANGIINFSLKNEYTSYMSLNRRKLELYYFSDPITQQDRIDVKGINDAKLVLHEKYFLDFIYFLFEMIQQDSINEVIKVFQNFYNDYINKKLDIGYYRTFNAESKFVLKWDSNTHKQLYAFDSISTAIKYKELIDISFNMNLLREIFSYFSNIYFTNKR